MISSFGVFILFYYSGRTRKFPSFVQGIAGLFIGLGEILGMYNYMTLYMYMYMHNTHNY